MVTKDDKKKKEVMKLLKSGEWFSMTNISLHIKAHYNKTESIVKDLLYDGLVERETRGSYTFWRIKKIKK